MPVANAMGGHVQHVFKKRDPSTAEDHNPDGRGFVGKMAKHAKVIKTFEAISRPMVTMGTGLFSMAPRSEVGVRLSSGYRVAGPRRFTNKQFAGPLISLSVQRVGG